MFLWILNEITLFQYHNLIYYLYCLKTLCFYFGGLFNELYEKRDSWKAEIPACHLHPSVKEGAVGSLKFISDCGTGLRHYWCQPRNRHFQGSHRYRSQYWERQGNTYRLLHLRLWSRRKPDCEADLPEFQPYSGHLGYDTGKSGTRFRCNRGWTFLWA